MSELLTVIYEINGEIRIHHTTCLMIAADGTVSILAPLMGKISVATVHPSRRYQLMQR